MINRINIEVLGELLGVDPAGLKTVHLEGKKSYIETFVLENGRKVLNHRGEPSIDRHGIALVKNANQ